MHTHNRMERDIVGHKAPRKNPLATKQYEPMGDGMGLVIGGVIIATGALIACLLANALVKDIENGNSTLPLTEETPQVELP
mgnify:CR=1 FL=1